MFGNANPVHEFYSGSDAVTAIASADIKGKTFVKLVAGSKEQMPRIVTAGAGERPYGVAGFDVKAEEAVTVFRSNAVLTVTAGAVMTVPTAVAVGANGKAVAAVAEAFIVGDLHQDVALDADAAVALTL